MWWEPHRKAEPCIQSKALFPYESSKEEQGTTHRTSKWKGRMANLLLGIPGRQQKKVFRPSGFSYARDLKRAEGKEKGKEPLTSPGQGGMYSNQEPKEKRERGWWRMCHQGREYHLWSANSSHHHCNKKTPSARKHQTTACPILVHVSLRAVRWWEPREQTSNRCLP